MEGISNEDILVVAKKMNIKKPQGIIDEIRAALKKWPDFAHQYGVDEYKIRGIQKIFPSI